MTFYSLALASFLVFLLGTVSQTTAGLATIDRRISATSSSSTEFSAKGGLSIYSNDVH